MQPTQNQVLSLATDSATATVSLMGACVLSYQMIRGSEAIHLLRPARETETNPLMTGCFPLIPYSGRIRNGRLNFGGQTYQLPLNFGDHPHSIHGTGWQCQWKLESQTDAEATLALEYPAGDWPFAFRARQTLRLVKADLHIAIELENTGPTPMPAGLGLHPYFPRHDGARVTANVEQVWLTDPTCLPVSREALPPQWRLGEGRAVEDLLCDNQFEGFHGPARIDWPARKLALEIDASAALDRLVVYAPDGQDFFCVEPVSHLADPFRLEEEGLSRQESGLRVLAPGESWCQSMTLKPRSA